MQTQYCIPEEHYVVTLFARHHYRRLLYIVYFTGIVGGESYAQFTVLQTTPSELRVPVQGRLRPRFVCI